MILDVIGTIHEVMAEAASGLLTRGQRSALALIGIVIGTASVVGTIVIGHNATIEAAAVFRGLGIDTMVAQVSSSAHPLTWNKTLSISERVRGIDRVEPIMTTQSEVASDDRHRGATIVASQPGFGALAGAELKAGRRLLPIDEATYSVIVGDEIAQALSSAGRPIVPGAKIRVGNYLFNVVGILNGAGSNPLLPFRLGESIIVPLASAKRAIAIPSIDLVLLHGSDLSDPQPVADAVTQDFLTQQQTPVTVQTARQMVDAQRQQQAVIGRLLAAVGGISLVVGGIGVTNVMLMGLLERRSEFGLRMAIGATPNDIMLTVLVEGALLGLVGGVVGTIFGVAAAAAFASYSGWAFAMPVSQLPIGAILSTFIGILFGLYPAIKAARLDPVVALRAG